MLKKVPSTYVIIFYIIIIAALLTWIIPGGEYVENQIVEHGIEKKVYEFHYRDNVKQTWQIFAALFKGFKRQSGIIVFILMIGGAFWIMNSSKAIDVGILSFLRLIKRIEHNRILSKLPANLHRKRCKNVKKYSRFKLISKIHQIMRCKNRAVVKHIFFG